MLPNTKRPNWPIVTASIAYGTAVTLLTGLIPRWGCWYSDCLGLRQQTNALLEGRLALSESPFALEHNLAWSQGGVHQVWGLGVPVWRLIFEAPARVFGHLAFPDRLAFTAALILTALVVIRSMAEASTVIRAERDKRMELLGGAILLLFFPPFIRLLQSEMSVYEEVVAYTILYGIVQLSLLVRFLRRPSALAWVVLWVFAGLGALLRPTLVFYGLATVGIAWFAARRNGGMRPDGKPLFLSAWQKLAGPGAYGFAAALLFFTNSARFGDGFEFGHRLNLQTRLPGNMYATRFDFPFQSEPISSAAKELFGALFLASAIDHNARYDWYRPGIFPGQSRTPRFREFYLATFHSPYFPLIVWGWLPALLMIFRLPNASRERRPWLASGDHGWIALWSLIATVQLAIFYLRTPAISSRYMLDFAPAFAAATLVAYYSIAGLLRNTPFHKLLIVACVAWVGSGLMRVQRAESAAVSVPRQELDALMAQRTIGEKTTVPNCGVAYNSETQGVPFEREGWDTSDGNVKPLISLLVWSPQFLELEVEHTSSAAAPSSPEDIRAKIGLEFLRRESIQPTKGGWRIRFHGAGRAEYQDGLQTAFVAFVSTERMADLHTPWSLKRATWREGASLANQSAQLTD